MNARGYEYWARSYKGMRYGHHLECLDVYDGAERGVRSVAGIGKRVTE